MLSKVLLRVNLGQRLKIPKASCLPEKYETSSNPWLNDSLLNVNSQKVKHASISKQYLCVSGWWFCYKSQLSRLPIKNSTSLLIGTWDNIRKSGDVFLLYCNNLTWIDKKVHMRRLAHVVTVLHMWLKPKTIFVKKVWKFEETICQPLFDSSFNP